MKVTNRWISGVGFQRRAICAKTPWSRRSLLSSSEVTQSGVWSWRTESSGVRIKKESTILKVKSAQSVPFGPTETDGQERSFTKRWTNSGISR